MMLYTLIRNGVIKLNETEGGSDTLLNFWLRRSSISIIMISRVY